MLIDAPSKLLNTVIHKKLFSHSMAKSMHELAHKSPLISMIVLKLPQHMTCVPVLVTTVAIGEAGFSFPVLISAAA